VSNGDALTNSPTAASVSVTVLDLAKRLHAHFGDRLSLPHEFRGEVTLQVCDAEGIAEVCQYAKTELGFDFLLDLCSVDDFDADPRFRLVYELYSLSRKAHLRLTTRVSEERAELPTVSGVWRTADWHEREVYDMMGIRFRGHPDLRRILMWEGYPYFPLRKDFPLAGKSSDVPGVAFTQPAPMAGGPFVTTAGAPSAIEREPRIRESEPKE
jgi:NADH-quinone oxidoreductase subunit C